MIGKTSTGLNERSYEISALLAKLASPTQYVRDEAAKRLRDVCDPPGREKWDLLLTATKPGDLKSDILRRFGTDTSTIELGWGTGPYHMETYRLDSRWVLNCLFFNESNAMGKPGNSLHKKAEVLESVQSVWMEPIDGFTGQRTGYYANGHPQIKGAYRSGKRTGTWNWYQPDGTPFPSKDYGDFRRN